MTQPNAYSHACASIDDMDPFRAQVIEDHTMALDVMQPVHSMSMLYWLLALRTPTVAPASRRPPFSPASPSLDSDAAQSHILMDSVDKPPNRSDPDSFIVIRNRSSADLTRIALESVLAVLILFVAHDRILKLLSIYTLLLTGLRLLNASLITPLAPFKQSVIVYPAHLCLCLYHKRTVAAILSAVNLVSLYSTSIGDFPARIYCIPPAPSDLGPTASIFRSLTDSWNLKLILLAQKRHIEFQDIPTVQEAMACFSLMANDFAPFASWLSISVTLGIVGSALSILPSVLLEDILHVQEMGFTEFPWLYVLGLGAAMLTAHTITLKAEYYGKKLGISVESVFMVKIYQKALRSHYNTNQSTGSILNLMNVDVDRMATISSKLFYYASNPIAITVGICFLYRLLGVAVMAAVVVMVLSLPVNWKIGTLITKYEDQVAASADERIERTSETFSAIRMIKAFTWETKFIDSIMESRMRELELCWRVFVVKSLSGFIFFCLPLLMSAASFICYVIYTGEPLTSPVAFTSIAVFHVLRHPLDGLFQTISTFRLFHASWSRVHHFLETPNCPPKQARLSCRQMALRNATFIWSDGKPAVSNVSLDLTQHSLYIVLGSTGSGKTALLLALLGELKLKSGTADQLAPLDSRDLTSNANKSINTATYCSETPWINSSTFKNNIIMSKPFDRSRYDEVIHRCALTDDLNNMTHGEETVLGPDGYQLSGEQKQRVALARALYSDAKYVLLDNCLNALDNRVAQHVYDNAITGSLLKNRVVVLVSNNEELAMSKAGMVIIMENGMIKRQGLSDEITTSGHQFTGPQGIQHSEPANDHSAHLDNHVELIEEEKRSEGHVRLKSFLHFSKIVGSPAWWTVMCAIFALVPLTEYITYFCLKIWSTANEAGSSHNQLFYAGIYIVSLIIYGAFSTLIEFITYSGSARASRIIFESTLEDVVHAKLSFYDSTPMGQIMNRLSKDVSVLDQELVPNSRVLVRCLLDALAVTVVIALAAPQFILLAVPLCAVYAFVGRLFLISSRELKRLDSIARSPILQKVEDTVTGAVTIRGYGHVEEAVKNMMNSIDMCHKCAFNLEIITMWLADWGNYVSCIVVVCTAIFVLKKAESIESGLSGLTLSYAMLFEEAIHWFIRTYGVVQINMNVIERFEKYNNLDQEERYSSQEANPPQSWLSKGKIVFKNFTVEDRTGALTLKRVNLTLEPGERVGVVENTCSEESTLITALLRLAEPKSGSIEIDGIDVSTMGLFDLRRAMAIMPKDPLLFSGTIRSNLSIESDYSTEELRSALDALGMKTLELDNEVSGRGYDFCQGERQLIWLARALLKKPKILVIDASAASTDKTTEQLVQKSIETHFKEATVVIIAKSINTVTHCDKIAVLQQGEVLKYGTAKQLVNNEG